ncbi:MAG: isocitrate lyase/phosphoenolpyruvate mutase family protein [Terriglobia bacterium]|jgi:2-methylisocitrate lyase-like PEP mutase family enzyme|nr:isocitrate lyase/phosphoenolpyruvate mutase family protein [Terriglobia bacterium]
MPNQQRTQAEKGKRFRELHQQDHAFIIPNPWDIGTAKLLESLGFEALATTSAGYAFSVGKPDGALSRDEMITHAAEIVAATSLPVSADLENLYVDDPTKVGETIRMAAAAGLAGCSIEDVPLGRGGEPYELQLAVDRVRAAAETAHALPFPFTLTARAENYIVGRPDLRDTIVRLQAFQEAGADVVFAPGLRTREDIATVVRSVDRPLNVIMGLQGVQLSLAELSEIGVKRISVGSALSRAALGAFLRGAHEMIEHGTFNFADDATKYADLNAMFSQALGNRAA